MASTPRGSSPSGVASAGRSKRPEPPTIDGTATEVSRSEVKPETVKAAETDTGVPPDATPAADNAAKNVEADRPAADVAAEAEQPSPAGVSATSGEAAAATSAAGTSPTTTFEHTETVVPPRDSVPPDAPPEEPGFTGTPPRDWPPERTWPLALMASAAALLVFLVIAGLWLAGMLGQGENPQLAQRLSRVETELRQLAARPAPTSAPDPSAAGLAARVTAAEQALQQLDQSGSRAGAGAGEQAMKRLDDLDARLAAADQASRQVEALDTRVKQLEALDAGLKQVEALDARVKQLEAAPPPSPTVATDPALVERLAAAEAAMQELRSTIQAMARQSSGADAQDKILADRLLALEAATKPVTDRVAELAGRLDQLATQVQAADHQAAAANSEAAAASRTAADATKTAADANKQAVENRAALGALRVMRTALLAASLRDAVARGEPYAPELSALAPNVPDKALLAPLEPFAATGVPSETALARELSELVPKLRPAAPAAAAGNSGSGGGVLDRLQASAEKLVRIRRVDETPGDDPAAIVSRIEASASRNDIDAARADLAKLPDAARAPAEAWIKKVEARRAARDAARRLASDTAAALGKE